MGIVEVFAVLCRCTSRLLPKDIYGLPVVSIVTLKEKPYGKRYSLKLHEDAFTIYRGRCLRTAVRLVATDMHVATEVLLHFLSRYDHAITQTITDK